MQHKRFNLLNPTKSVQGYLTGLKLSAVFLLVFGLTGLQAQEALLTSGGNASGSNGSVSYSIGQFVYHTLYGTNASVAEGVQHPREITVELSEVKNLKLTVSAYPNPTTDYLTLAVENPEFSDLIYQLYDLNGKLLQNGTITGNQIRIAMGNLAPASSYFVKIILDNKEVKTFKIIKN